MKRLYAFWLSLCLLASLPVRAETISTAGIISASASIACMKYRVIGLCFWYDNHDVEVSLKVGHYNPDLVVSAYNGIGGNPWVEAKAVYGTAQVAGASAVFATLGGIVPVPGGGMNRNSGAGTTNKKSHKNFIFKEADAIGHPSAALSLIGSMGGYICPSQAYPLYPYMLSSLDALSWRLGLPESIYPQALIPGMREIGQFPVNTWGAVYPRSGFVTQHSPSKAAAVIAQRSGDIVTRRWQPHVYTPITSGPRLGSRGMKVWYPTAPLMEGQEKTGKWQMLVPNKENSCSTFGTNDIATVAGWGGGKVSSSGDYAWNLWRPYKCCRDRGHFLFDVNFQSYP